MVERARKSIRNWRRYRSSKWYESDENLRFGIWRSAVAPSDSTEKMAVCVHNYYSPSGAQKPQRYFGKFTSCMTFGAHKLVRSEPFLDSVRIWQLLLSVHSVMWKKFYIAAHLRSWPYCGGIFFKSLSYLYEVGAQTFLAHFWTVRIFDRKISRKLWRHLTTKIRTV